MSEIQPSPSQPQNQHQQNVSRGSGSRNRRGSRRGQRNGPGVGNTAAVVDPPIPAPGAAVGGSASSSSSCQPRGGRNGGQRGNQDRRGGARQGRLGPAASVMGPQRSFGGHLTGSQGPAEDGSALNAGAPEFVPGRPTRGQGSSRVARGRPGHQQHGPNGRQRGPNGHEHEHGPSGQHLIPSRRVKEKSSAIDLSTRIQEDIDNGQYECVICTNEVVRTSRVWSCSICWTVAHVHCVKKWHANQTKKAEENQNGNPEQATSWRCPGCNSSLVEEPGAHRCWCGKDINPKPIPGLPSHSCGQTCSKARANCPHTCYLMCHAGPCPPCTLMGPTQTCFCGKHTSTKPCSETDYGKGFSCDEICGDFLPCGEHTCSRPCHSGLCGGCDVPVPSSCYCGKERREMACDGRDHVRESFGDGVWFDGCFRCDNLCRRVFDCGYHQCQKSCHAQDAEPAHCPFSPDLVKFCPCGKTPLDNLTEFPRQTCQDTIAHCDETCNKRLSCGHSCAKKCHAGECPPCFQTSEIGCRCGRTFSPSVCHQGAVTAPVCFRVCRAQLNCGRHECGDRCCPGEKKAAERRKQKRGFNRAAENFEAEHICLQPCGRQLKCGRHACQQLCHRGPCGSCLEAVFDEIACACGRTVLYPPQPCGTPPPECRYECTRPRPCGHPVVSHQCHAEDLACPKCPFLVEKGCICGKKKLKNQPCWFDEVRCGLPCEKQLKCGAHECRKTCHRPGECEDAEIAGSHCAQPCGKTQKSCAHACTDQCHSPFACKEDKACQSKTFVTCPCQNRKKEVKCGATRLNSWPEHEALKCDDECLRLQRNHRLAEALNVDPDHEDDHVPYSDTTLKLLNDVGMTWAQTQEREFRVFAAEAAERRLRFKPMPSSQRAFLHALAEDYGLDSESQDPGPHRHVCVFKTPRFVSAPTKTLAQSARLARAAAALGAAASSTTRPAAATAGVNHGQEPFNALLLTGPRFGLTIDELDAAMAPDFLAATARTRLQMTTRFLSSDEIVVHAKTTSITAARVVTLAKPTPEAIEAILAGLKAVVSKSMAHLVGAVALCHVVEDGSSLRIVRREGDAAAGTGAGGWSAVAARRRKPLAAVAEVAKSTFVALKPRAKAKPEQVEEDWLVAAEKLLDQDEKGDDGEEDTEEGRVGLHAS